MSSISRKGFLVTIAGAAGAAAGLSALGQSDRSASAEVRRDYGGVNLAGWIKDLGDGLFPPDLSLHSRDLDIQTVDQPTYSELIVNARRRNIMTHNITHFDVRDLDGRRYSHLGGYEFRIPYPLQEGNLSDNGQTVEGGFALWDGTNTRLDYQVLFQWYLNPYPAEPGKPQFGDLHSWLPTSSGSGWVRVGNLTPDMNWHRVQFVLDFQRLASSIVLDGMVLPSAITALNKPFPSETVTRLQVEAINLYPSSSEAKALHRVQVRNWYWVWEQVGLCSTFVPYVSIPTPNPAAPTATIVPPIQSVEAARWTWRGAGNVEGPSALSPASPGQLLFFHGDLKGDGGFWWRTFSSGQPTCRPSATAVAELITGGSDASRRTLAEEKAMALATQQGISNWRSRESLDWCA